MIFCSYDSLLKWIRASLIAQLVKNPSAMQETLVQFWVWEDLLEKGSATHSSARAAPVLAQPPQKPAAGVSHQEGGRVLSPRGETGETGETRRPLLHVQGWEAETPGPCPVPSLHQNALRAKLQGPPRAHLATGKQGRACSPAHRHQDPPARAALTFLTGVGPRSGFIAD